MPFGGVITPSNIDLFDGYYELEGHEECDVDPIMEPNQGAIESSFIPTIPQHPDRWMTDIFIYRSIAS